METQTIVTVTMTPDDLSALISSAVRACLQDAPPAPDNGGGRSGRPNRKMLSPRDIEDEFGITRRMLMSWRRDGIGPAYTNFGKRVFYNRAAFEKFVTAGQIQTTGFIDQ